MTILRSNSKLYDMKRNSKITWKKGIFKCTFQLFSGTDHIGHLKDSEFSRSAIGELNNKKYRFTTHGHLNPKTEIFDLQEKQTVGQIRYYCWYPKARIEYRGKVSQWKFSNLWETRWRIFDQSGTTMQFAGWEKKGSIKIHTLDEALVLAGLHISNYYWRMVGVIVAISFPLLFFGL